MPEVLVVHCVDTEGIFNEGLDATFSRINEKTGISVVPSEDNLELIRLGKHPQITTDASLLDLIDSRQISFIDNLDDHHDVLMDLMTGHRNKLLDSFGKGYVWTWHTLDFVGFKTNPRKRIEGHHPVFDLFNRYIEEAKKVTEVRDILQWHYHHPPFDGSGIKSGVDWFQRGNYSEILSRKILDRMWFPCSFRPGEHIERNAISFWLEQWFPFDYASRSIEKGRGNEQPDDDGRRHDWRRAPTEWGAYRPDYRDYQVPGDMKRHVARILDTKARAYSIDEFEVEKAFEQASKASLPVILAVMNHDYRDMRPDHTHMTELLRSASEKYPEIPFRYCHGVEAMRRHLGLESMPPIHLDVNVSENGRQVDVMTDRNPFGPEPWFCFETNRSEAVHEPLYRIGENHWRYQFQIPLADVKAVGLACNDDAGNTSVLKMELPSGKIRRAEYNYEQ
jgi:hypothetical protein